MTELPKPGFLVVFGIFDAEWVRLDLAESVKVELTDEGREVVVLEEFWNNFGSKFLDIFDNKSESIVCPVKLN